MSVEGGAADEKQVIPNQVFVGGMTPETSMEQLTKHLAGLSLKPVGAPTPFLNAEGNSKGCALIPFGNPEDVTAAVTALHGSELVGQKLRARADQGPSRSRRRQQLNQDNSYVYVGNLAPETTEEELKALFAPYGQVAFASINRKRRSEQSQGWATVQLGSEDEAQKALGGLNGFSFKEKALTVEHLRSLPRKARVRKERETRDPNMPALENAEPEAPADPCVVWVGNLAWTTTEDQLKALFEQQGEVKEVTITRQKRSNQSRGWGTVTFATPEAAAAAVSALHGTSLEQRPIEVQIRRGPRRRRRTPREPRETNEEGGAAPRRQRRRRQRQPRSQNGDEEPRTSQRPRRPEPKQPQETNAEEGKAPPRRRRARRPRNDSQREDNTAAAPAEQGDKNPRRRRQRRKPEGEAASGDDQQARPRAEKKEPERIIVEHPDQHLYVRNLAWEVSNEDLKSHFAQCGTVLNATVTLNTKGTSRGWGTVEMSNAEEAQKALALDKQKFKDRQLIVRLDRRVKAKE